MKDKFGSIALAGAVAGMGLMHLVQGTELAEGKYRSIKVDPQMEMEWCVCAPVMSRKCKEELVQENYKGLVEKTLREKKLRTKKPFKDNHDFLEARINDIFDYWYGTPWDFFGTSIKPGQGEIACGYFVTTVLNHLGYRNVDYVKLAQQPASKIIKEFADAKDIAVVQPKPEKLEEYVRKKGQGYYILGLMNHVGFVFNDGKKIYFIHSNPIDREGVIKELLVGSDMVAASDHLMIGGPIFSREMVARWLREHYGATATTTNSQVSSK